jgi:hypothetical protein
LLPVVLQKEDRRESLRGLSCEPPFDEVLVDAGHSLFNFLHTKRVDGDGEAKREEQLQTTEQQLRFFFEVVSAVEWTFGRSPQLSCFRHFSSHNVVLRGANRSPVLVVEDEAGAGGDDLGRWLAPELLLGTSKVATEHSLVYTLGLVIQEVMTGEIPFSGMDCNEIKTRLSERQELVQIPSDAGLWDVVRICLRRFPADRITLSELKTRFFRGLDGSPLVPAEAPSDEKGKEDLPLVELVAEGARKDALVQAAAKALTENDASGSPTGRRNLRTRDEKAGVPICQTPSNDTAASRAPAGRPPGADPVRGADGAARGGTVDEARSAEALSGTESLSSKTGELISKASEH